MNKSKKQPEDKIERDENGIFVCTECGEPLVPYYEQDGADDSILTGFYKCDHSGGEEEYELNGATHHA